jgi:hypothetical protein
VSQRDREIACAGHTGIAVLNRLFLMYYLNRPPQ